jgi:hypothetical protein
MPQKQNSFVLGTAQAAKKTFYFLTFLDWICFYRFFKKFLNISSTLKSSKTHRITREMLKDQLHLLKLNFAKDVVDLSTFL